MSIYIYKNQQSSGPYSEADIAAWLRSGQLIGTDLACRAGTATWQPLADIISVVPAPQSLAAYSSAAEWARKTMTEPIDVVGKYDSIVYRIILGLLFLVVPILLVFAGAAVLVASGNPWLLIVGVFVFLMMGGLFAFIRLLAYFRRQRRITRIDAEGVNTGKGDRLLWADLQYLKYHKYRMRYHSGYYKPNSGLLDIFLIDTAIAFIYRGTDRVTIEFGFTNGKALLPPLILRSKEIHSFVRSVPVQQIGDLPN